MAQQVIKSGSDSFREEAEGHPSWASGWYLFEDGKVVGPLRAEEAFAKTEQTPLGQSRLVSRKGFTQWYPLRDFAELHVLADKYAHQLAAVRSNTLPQSHQFAGIQPVAKQVGPDQHNLDKKLAASIAKIETARVEVVRIADDSKSLSRRERKRLKYEEKEKERKDKKAVVETASSPVATIHSAPRRVTFDDQYLLVASRLRLGRTRSPFAAGFIYTPVTLFGYWGAWMSRAAEELTWHLTGSSRVNFVLPMWMSLIPGVHLFFAWMLARLVAETEQQNGYRTISPWFATVVAVLPPFYMMMIQSAMNRHWRLHVYNSVKPIGSNARNV